MKKMITFPLLLVTSLSLTTACTSQIVGTNTHVQSYIGSNIKRVQNLYLTPRSQSISFTQAKTFAWDEKIEPFNNGDTLHSFSNPYENCTINWVADESGIIKSGSYFGEQCSR